MGSSSKKNKSSKESRKRRHRSRSNSDDSSRERDKEKHRHRRHHKEKRHEKPTRHRDYDSEGSDILPVSPQQSRDDSPSNQSTKNDAANINQSVESLSIEETNKLRAKLGLKPLEVNSSRNSSDSSKNDGKIKDDLGEFYHKPASNLAEKTEQEKIRAKLNERKEKRHIDNKLSKVKTLGESDSEDDTHVWVERNRKIQMEKEQALKRAKMLEELDEEFGIGDIVESEVRKKKEKVYSTKNLRGLKVEHDVKNFAEGKSVILTLKDQDVLADDGDVLINVNMIDNEKYEKNVENKKKKPLYHPYADEEFDEYGNPKEKSLLSKYDEEIDGAKKSTFVIGESISEPKKSLLQSVKEKLSNKRLESLVLPELNLASEYYTEEEMTKFKKPKKKVKKLRTKGKILTAAELAAQVAIDGKNDHGSRKRKLDDNMKSENNEGTVKGEFTEWMDIDDLPEMKPILDDMVKVEPDDSNLERALHKARRLKQREAITNLPAVETLLKTEPQEESTAVDSGSIVLNATAEFCRSLGDIPTYGKSGNRDEDADLIDFERETHNSKPTSSWNPVDSSSSTANDAVLETTGLDAPILDEEPDVGSGVGAALRLALSKGYLDKEENNRPSTSKFAHLQARHYSIEDKTYGDDEKFGGRRERYTGPTLDFKEKDSFRPNVKLEYIDDEGRVLNPKEAFRYLSHKFHGKGPGKNKIEKRLKKQEQEGLMKKMSSTDTPLGTLNMLQHKQKEMQSPYIVLSGSKHTHSTTISKSRR